MKKLWKRRPSPAMVVALVALVAALGGTAYAANRINGNLIEKQSIGAGKIKKNSLTGYQINTDKLGTVPVADRARDTYWAVVHNPAGPGNAVLVRASDPSMSIVEAGGAVAVIFPGDVAICANVAARDNASTMPPLPGYAQTNISPANAAAIEVHTRAKDGSNEDGDFHLLVVCPI